MCILFQPADLEVPHLSSSILALLHKLDVSVLLLSMHQASQVFSSTVSSLFSQNSPNPRHNVACLQLTADNEQLRRQLSDVQSAAEARERELQQEVQRHSSKVAELEDRIAEVMTETTGHRVP